MSKKKSGSQGRKARDKKLKEDEANKLKFNEGKSAMSKYVIKKSANSALQQSQDKTLTVPPLPTQDQTDQSQDERGICDPSATNNNGAVEKETSLSGIHHNKATTTSAKLVILDDDPHTWPVPLSPAYRDYLQEIGPQQKRLIEYPKVQNKCFDSKFFDRDWLLYSESSNSLYCFSCSLFLNNKQRRSPWVNIGKRGFQGFYKLSTAIKAHEQTRQHFGSKIDWEKFKKMLKENKGLVSQFSEARAKQVSFYKSVIQGLLDAIVYCARNNIALQGASHDINDRNCGNYLSLVKLLSKHYTPLALHLEGLRKNCVSYLSPDIQNQFIECIASKIRSTILDKIRKCIYFSIIFDSTPDISRHEQICQIIRFVYVSENGCYVEETFIDFINFSGKTGEQITAAILEKLKQDNIDIMNCRGQGYDNGKNYASDNVGVQTRILAVNPYACFFNCTNHSLNRVGVNAANNVSPAKSSHETIQNLYNFFSRSTRRWETLKKHSQALKCESSTRWSAKFESVAVIYDNYDGIIEALLELNNDELSSKDTRKESIDRLNDILNFKFILSLTIWYDVLGRIDIVNQILQREGISVEEASKHLSGLLDWLFTFKDEGFSLCINDAKARAEKHDLEESSGFDYRFTRCVIPVRYRDRINSEQPVLTNNLEKFKVHFFDALMTKLIEDFKDRFNAVHEKTMQFNFLWGKNLNSKDNAFFTKRVKDLCKIYPLDYERKSFIREAKFLKTAISPFLPKTMRLAKTSALDILNILYQNHLENQFVNCQKALRIFLSFPVSVAEGERSFSKLKLIKTALRNRMGQERLSDLSILSIEHGYLDELNFDEIIHDFATKKCRKVAICDCSYCK